MTADTVTQLRALQARLADPERWTQGYYARTATGEPCDANDPGAVRWCIIGLLLHMHAPIDVGSALDDAVAVRFTAYRSVAQVNDTHGLDAVRLVVANAIAAAEAEEGAP